MNYYITPKGQDKIEEYIDSQPLHQSRDYTLRRGKFPPIDINILSIIESQETSKEGISKQSIIDSLSKVRVTRKGNPRISAIKTAFNRLESLGYIGQEDTWRNY